METIQNLRKRTVLQFSEEPYLTYNSAGDYYYEAWAEDADSNDYIVKYFDLADNFNEITDESEACDWDSYKVYNEYNEYLGDQDNYTIKLD